MSYNPAKDMPRTAEQLEICVDHYFNQGQQKYEAEVVAATAQAEAAYAKLPESEDKPTLAEYIAQVVGMIQPAQTREEWKQHFLAAGYGPQAEPEPMPAPTEAELFAQLRSIREVKFREYDEAVSQLERKARIGENVASQLAAWDAYAIALCELPEQPGAPWDGGGSATPWPVKP